MSWRSAEGLPEPLALPSAGEEWLSAAAGTAHGSFVRLRPERPNHVWSCDFVSAVTHDGRTLRLLAPIDEHPREGLAIWAAPRLGSPSMIQPQSQSGYTSTIAYSPRAGTSRLGAFARIIPSPNHLSSSVWGWSVCPLVQARHNLTGARFLQDTGLPRLEDPPAENFTPPYQQNQAIP